MFGFNGNRDKSAPRWVQKMNSTIQAAIQSLFKVRWSALPRRATSAYLDLFHTSPRLDALDMIATDCANSVFKVYRKADLRTGAEGAEPIGDHQIYDLLENPIPDHPEFDGFMVRYLTIVYVELNGECFWIILRDQKGRPREIYPIPSNWCIQTPTEAQPWYLIVPLQNTAGRTMQIDPRDVVWFKSPDVLSPYGRGRGRTEAVGDELETDEFAAKYAKNFFYNNATPETVMTMPGATDAQLKAFKADWNTAHQGIINASKMGFLNFDAKIHQLQTSPKEMDFNESRRFLRDMMNQHWRIPPEVMGILDNSNRSTIDAADYLYKKNVVSPRNIRWETTVNRQLMPMFGVEWAIKCDNIVPEDKEFNKELANDGWKSGALTRDQWLGLNKLPQIGGELGAQYLVPINMIATSSAASMRDVTPQAPRITEEDQQAGNVNAQSGGEDTSHPTSTTNNQPVLDTPVGVRPIEDDSSKSYKVYSDEHKLGIWKSFDKAAEGTEGIYEASVKRFAETQKKAFKAAVTKQSELGKKPKDAADIATAMVFTPKINEALKTALTPGWLASMSAGEKHALSTLGMEKGKGAKKDVAGTSFDVSNPRFLDWIQQFGLDRAAGMNDTTLTQLRDHLRDVIASGIEDGLSERDMVAGIMDAADQVWGVMTTSRAHNIARTESTATVNYGTVITYSENGISKKEWLATNDGRTRPEHAAASTQVVDVDKAFTVGGEKLMYPGDPSGRADNVCQCRCTVIAVIEE